MIRPAANTNTKHFLTDEQAAIARQLQAVLDPTEVEDGFMAMISILAGTANAVADNGAMSLALGRAVAASIVELVEAGQRGEVDLAPQAARRP